MREKVAECRSLALEAAGTSRTLLGLVTRRVTQAVEVGAMGLDVALETIDTLTRSAVNVAKLGALLAGDPTERLESRSMNLHAYLPAPNDLPTA